MNILKHVFLGLVMLTILLGNIRSSNAAHYHSAEIYWECLPTGEFKFYVTLYRDCSIDASVTLTQLTVLNAGPLTSIPLSLSAGFPQDATPTECGYSCADEFQDLSLEKYQFESAPTALPAGPPPPEGYTFYWNPCCRINANNLVNSENDLTYFMATMYPYNGQSVNPCYDSSPQFAAPPSNIQCSGYQLRYNPNAIDPDIDSLSYSLVPAQVDTFTVANYAAGFSPTQPFPSPSSTTLDATTGQLEYDSSPSVAGRYVVVMAIDAWRCGQRISRSLRDMTFAFMACNDNNNIPQVTPNWNLPVTGNGYSVEVPAGETVNFSLSAIDDDLINGQPQTIELTAEGEQFSSNFSNPNSGCLNTPCATLSNSTPPTSGAGSVSTIFNWETTCDHVATHSECATLSSTYNFLFKFRDDYCPASGINFVNVAVTVKGEPIVDSPVPHCASTNADGSVTLYWETVTDNNVPQSFVEYVIFHSTSPTGPFTTEVGTVPDINTGTWTHNVSNSNPPTTSGPNYYTIRTRSGCNDAEMDAPFDTISSIYLNLVNAGAAANLSWNPVATPALSSTDGIYHVYKEYPSGVWNEIGQTTGLTYTDPIEVCNDSIGYRIELEDNLTCTSVSNIAKDLFDNTNPPAPQPIDSVTVDPVTGYITVCWPPSTSPDVVQYNILLNPDAFAWVPMDTVYGYNNTCWMDSVTDASSQPLWYQVYATNNCDVPGVPSGSIADGTDHHETIFLLADYDSCSVTTELNWTAYWYWQQGVEGYDVYASQDNGMFVKIGTTSDTTFTHMGLQESSDYCYFVRAIRTGDNATASSNGRCITAYVPKRPDYGYNYNTTVQPGNTGIEEYFFSDSIAGYLGFEIQRGTEPDALSYQWYIPFDPNTRFYSYIDAGARPESNSYYYSVIGVDSCDQHADTLNTSRTILLEAEANSDRTNTLLWNPYQGWNGGVTAYNIYRSIDGPFEFLTTVPPNQLTYLDTVQEILIGEGNFCYYIEAVEGIGTPVGTDDPVTFMELSRSNEDCAPQLPNVFMPNAFMPEGVNNTFKPVTVYVQTGSYLFQVYDRWGNRVFETTDPNQGWDGSSGGKKNPQGAYVYFISFVSSTDQTYTKTGSVTLIR